MPANEPDKESDSFIEVAGLLALLMNAEGAIGFGVKELNGSSRLANPAMARLLGQRAGQLLGKSESERRWRQVVPSGGMW